jgi:hypothetical protein
MQITFDGEGAIVGTAEDEVIGYTGATSINGGDGNDTLSYSDNSTGVVVDLSDNTNNITNIENITGGSGNDTLTGDANANILDGGLGVDSINGGAGNDSIVFDSNDSLSDGGIGFDTLILDEVGTIDFGNSFDNVKNIEQIDMTNNLTNNIQNITLSDVIESIGTGTELRISGDDADSVDSTNLVASDGWTDTSTTTTDTNGTTYNVYSQDDAGTTYKLLIQTQIDDSI